MMLPCKTQADDDVAKNIDQQQSKTMPTCQSMLQRATETKIWKMQFKQASFQNPNVACLVW